MSAKLENKRSLRELLDRLVAAQKEDIYAYSSGHLNESKLFNPPPSSSPRPSTWSSSQRRASAHHPAFSPECADATKMQSALASFALGLGSSVTEAGEMPGKGLQSLRRSSETSDSLLQTFPSNHVGHGSSAKVDRFQGDGRRVVPKHLESITKAEEFQKMRDFEADILQKKSVLRGNLCTGKDRIDQLTHHLDKELDRLESRGFGLGFHRLEAHSAAFDQINHGSKTFGGLLGKIKRAYDDYLSHLLDGHVTKHRVLQDQLTQLTDMHTVNAAAIQKEAQTLEELEQQAIDALERNKRIRAELRREKELASLPQPEISMPTVVRSEQLEPSEQVERLNGAICNVLDLTKQLRVKIRKECVPTTVCNYLRHCIKENDVEIQRMTSQKEYYERSISELTGDLREAIETADTTESDAKKIWKKLESQPLKSEVNRGTGFWGCAGGGADTKKDDPGSDEDDSDKWNFYIS